MTQLLDFFVSDFVSNTVNGLSEIPNKVLQPFFGILKTQRNPPFLQWRVD